MRAMQILARNLTRLPAFEVTLMHRLHRLRALAALLLLCAQFFIAPALFAAEDELPPLQEGPYVAPMFSAVFAHDRSVLDNGKGGILGLGYRKDFYAVEIAPTYGEFDKAKFYGAAINGLLFPFKSSGLYATVGVSGTEFHRYQLPGGGRKDFSTVNGDGGLGYLFPVSFGNYEFGVRAEARYRIGHRDTDDNDADLDINAPHRFSQILVNVGLQLPTRLAQHPKAPPEPVTVVPVADTDGDGVLDNTDQCPDTPKGTKVDAKGCPVPKPVCKTPVPGGRVNLEGCGTGDSIVLNGVNFESNKAELTANAKTILDEVAEELAKYPDVAIEVGGHTDSKAAEVYNQRLSEHRAHSVLDYLSSKGVAASRMTAIGYGEGKPVADNGTEQGRELNRRVELKITAGTAVVAEPASASAPAAEAGATPAPAAP